MNFDNKYLKISLYALLVIIIAILFEKIISNLPALNKSLESFLSICGSVLAPFIVALFIAFFLNPLVRFLEKRILPGSKANGRAKRIVCSLFALVAFITAIVVIISVILPELINNILQLYKTLPETINNFKLTYEQMRQSPNTTIESYIAMLVEQEVEPLIERYGSVTDITSNVITSTLKLGKGVMSFIIGVIVAFYFLIYKDGFKQYASKVLYVMFTPERAEKIIENGRRINKVFEGFFVGKSIDSCIIGILFFLITNIFIKPKFVILSSVIVGVTNMIPFFGPFIGGIPVVLINLFYDPKKAIVVGIAILMLQLFDGYILGPKILGDSTGLSPLWVIVAIIIMGALFGVAGMFLGVPIFGVIKMFADEYFDRKFKMKYHKQAETEKVD